MLSEVDLNRATLSDESYCRVVKLHTQGRTTVVPLRAWGKSRNEMVLRVQRDELAEMATENCEQSNGRPYQESTNIRRIITLWNIFKCRKVWTRLQHGEYQWQNTRMAQLPNP